MDNFIDNESIKLANSHLYKTGIKKSVSTLGAEPVAQDMKKKYVPKILFRNIAIGVVLVAMISTAFVNNFLKNRKNAKDYITNNIVSEISMDVNKDSVEKFIIEMKSKGISEDVALYYIKDVFGNEIFDKFVQTMGYKDGGSYIVDKGYQDKFLRNSYSGIPDENHYNFDMSKEMIEEVDEIKESKMGK